MRWVLGDAEPFSAERAVIGRAGLSHAQAKAWNIRIVLVRPAATNRLLDSILCNAHIRRIDASKLTR
jgi:hypothetical protein